MPARCLILTQAPGCGSNEDSCFTDEKVKVKVTHSCLTFGKPMDYRVHGILQARILEWLAFPFSRGSSQPRIEARSPALQETEAQTWSTADTIIGPLGLGSLPRWLPWDWDIQIQVIRPVSARDPEVLRF